jgi:hypothetical protein
LRGREVPPLLGAVGSDVQAIEVGGVKAEHAPQQIVRFDDLHAGFELLGRDAVVIWPPLEQHHHGPRPLLGFGHGTWLHPFGAADIAALLGAALGSVLLRHGKVFLTSGQSQRSSENS